MNFYAPRDPKEIKKEREMARELRDSTWWRDKLREGVCYYCEETFSAGELTMDHLVPVARGGQSTRSNCVVSCKGCNTAKGTRTAAEWRLEQMTSKKT